MTRDWPLILILVCTGIVIYIYVRSKGDGLDLDDIIDYVDERLIESITLDKAEYEE